MCRKNTSCPATSRTGSKGAWEGRAELGLAELGREPSELGRAELGREPPELGRAELGREPPELGRAELGLEPEFAREPARVEH